jgi:hypothetical protein
VSHISHLLGASPEAFMLDRWSLHVLFDAPEDVPIRDNVTEFGEAMTECEAFLARVASDYKLVPEDFTATTRIHADTDGHVEVTSLLLDDLEILVKWLLTRTIPVRVLIERNEERRP